MERCYRRFPGKSVAGDEITADGGGEDGEADQFCCNVAVYLPLSLVSTPHSTNCCHSRSMS